MKQEFINRIRLGAIAVCSLFVMVLFSACSGVATTGNVNINGTSVPSTTIHGTIASVNPTAHSVTLNVNGQQVTVSGLTDQQIAQLQAAQAQNKDFQFTVAQNGSNGYVIAPNTEPTENNDSTPVANSNGAIVGTIQFTGQVQNSSSSSITVRLPDGQNLQANIVSGQTNLGDNAVVPGNGQFAKVTVTANADGSYTATKLDTAKADDVQKDQNTVEYQGKTTSAVGSDGKLNFQVGSKTYSYQIITGADLKDFGGNAQGIQNNTPIKVKVTFNGSTGTVTSVSNNND
ncbi:MAG TPA: hypothetical protein VKR06_36675 [Ktedonosporobacter sp.]|nr:hypothetical protein [Ktedonosporobacter sp.]